MYKYGKSKGSKWINNGKITKMVHGDLSKWLSSGWQLGRLNVSEEIRKKYAKAVKGTVWINKDGKSKMVMLDKLQKYLENGFVLGRSKFKNKLKIKRETKIEIFINKKNNIKEFLYKEYKVKNKSINEIAKENDINYFDLKTLLIDIGIGVKTHSERTKGRRFTVSEEGKRHMREAAKKPEVILNRSKAQKQVWSKLTKEQRVKRTKNGNIARSNNINRISRNTSIEIKIENQLKENGLRFEKQKYIKYNDKYYYADFYLPDKNLIVECYGDYWHANPNIYKDNDVISIRKVKILVSTIRKENEIRENNIKSLGYNFIYVWENDINKDNFNIIDYIGENNVKSCAQ